jgi:hypothetical protein
MGEGGSDLGDENFESSKKSGVFAIAIGVSGLIFADEGIRE